MIILRFICGVIAGIAATLFIYVIGLLFLPILGYPYFIMAKILFYNPLISIGLIKGKNEWKNDFKEAGIGIILGYLTYWDIMNPAEY